MAKKQKLTMKDVEAIIEQLIAEGRVIRRPNGGLVAVTPKTVN